jgi:hypothetical protein
MRLFHVVSNRFKYHSKPTFRYSAVLVFLLMPFFIQAQNYPSGPTSLSPAVQPTYKVNKHTREVKRVQAKVKHSAEYEFYDRVQKAAKAKKRALRKLAKPQYTNPLYFGHKNPPKKHPAHKMRFCKECGIRH